MAHNDITEYTKYPERVLDSHELSFDAYAAALKINPRLYNQLHVNVRGKYPELINCVMDVHPEMVIYLPLKHFKIEHLLVGGSTLEGCTLFSTWVNSSSLWRGKITSLLQEYNPSMLTVFDMYEWEPKIMLHVFKGNALESHTPSLTIDFR